MAKKLSTTPKGVAIFPRLTGKPDDKFNKNGVWSVKLGLKSDEAAPMIAAIDEVMKTSLAEAKEKFVVAKAEFVRAKTKGKKPPKEPEMMDAPYFVDEESGDVTFTFKMTASGENKKDKTRFTQKPALFDAKGKPITGEIKIGGGSTIKVSYELIPFATALGAGASLRLKAVQVIELVEFGGNADYFGFDAEEGFSGEGLPESSAAEDMGFTAEDAEATTATDGTEADDF